MVGRGVTKSYEIQPDVQHGQDAKDGNTQEPNIGDVTG